jgi:aminoglycoside N3'-acetyltransferase/acyl carrier protein
LIGAKSKISGLRLKAVEIASATIKAVVAEALEIADPLTLPDDAGFGRLPEWDSFGQIRVMQALNEVFGTAIEGEDIDSVLTFSNIVSFLNGHVTESTLSRSVAETEAALSWLWQANELRPNDIVYVHSRTQGLPAGLGNLMGILSWLQGYEQRRTVIMPAFPFQGRGYADHLARRAPFSVLHTPAKTGLLPELLRFLPGSSRSAHPLLSECAIGPHAVALTSRAHSRPHPFHPASTYAQMVEADAVMLGLGVDIGTNALIHWVDDVLKDQYDFPIFEPNPVDFEVEFADGAKERIAVLPYAPSMTKRIKPRMIRPLFADHRDHLIEGEVGGVPFYRLRLVPFIETCLQAGRAALRDGRLPPWYPA